MKTEVDRYYYLLYYNVLKAKATTFEDFFKKKYGLDDKQNSQPKIRLP